MKRLIVCSDGTWNTKEADRDGRSTNVVKMARAIAPAAPDGTPQVVFYDEGVGTSGGLWDRLLGGATGAGLSKNVGDAYQFLVDNYQKGDQVFLFGFSRGAYTARSTVGLIRKCGLLHKTEAHRFPEAYAFYRGGDHPDSEPAVEFRKKYSRELTVQFLGVWDTVGALGIPWGPVRAFTARRYQFHDVALSRIVKNAFHAVAIDERRKAYEPALWSTKPVPGQTVEQVWFAGAHSGVGGGYAHSGLSDVAFRWMMERAGAAGLAFDADYVGRHVRPDPKGPLVPSHAGLWKLLPGGWRTIGDPGHQPQSVSEAAIERYADAALKYAPPNLVKYLEEHAVRTPEARPGTPAPRPARRAAAPPVKSR